MRKLLTSHHHPTFLCSVYIDMTIAYLSGKKSNTSTPGSSSRWLMSFSLAPCWLWNFMVLSGGAVRGKLRQSSIMISKLQLWSLTNFVQLVALPAQEVLHIQARNYSKLCLRIQWLQLKLWRIWWIINWFGSSMILRREERATVEAEITVPMIPKTGGWGRSEWGVESDQQMLRTSWKAAAFVPASKKLHIHICLHHFYLLGLAFPTLFVLHITSHGMVPKPEATMNRPNLIPLYSYPILNSRAPCIANPKFR